MAVRLRDTLMREVGQLRFEPTNKRVSATLGGERVVDTTDAWLVWEPRRIVPYYAVPAADLKAELVPVPGPVGGPSARIVPLAPEGGAAGAPRIMNHGNFDSHTSDGERLTVRAAGAERLAAAFRVADPDLSDRIILDFDAFDAWYEEDDPIVGHPRDPFHRVDVRRSSRHVRIEADGAVVAESSHPRLLFETHLPVRFYLPHGDVAIDRLAPSATRTTCAYKGHASYWSLGVDREGAPVDVAWSYRQPLPDAVEIAGMFAFFDERVDVVVDGQRRPRPLTPWS